MPDLSPAAEDALIAALLIALPLLTGALVMRGFRPFAVIRAMLRRAAGTAALFVGLIAVALALGLILTAQERGLRQASARAADPFDIVVAAPGSEVTAMLASVYLQPADLPLLTGAQMAEIAATPGIRLAAPLGFGDSVDGLPVIGTTAALVDHVAGAPGEGRAFARAAEVVVGARTPFAVGARLQPAHGHGPAAEDHGHAGEELVVVGRLAPTGGPWDRAVITPIETLWHLHGLPDGHPVGDAAGADDHDHDHDHDAHHADGEGNASTGPDADANGHAAADGLPDDHAPAAPPRPIGPPWDTAHLPGIPAMVIDTADLGAAYSVRAALSRPDMMAFFPGAVLSQLHVLLGDVRAALSVMALATQALVTVAVLAGLTLVMALFADQFRLLSQMGAPLRFTLAVSWGFAALLILAGTALGTALALALMGAASRLMTDRLGITVSASLGWPEIHMIAGFVALMLLAALIPAWRQMRRG